MNILTGIVTFNPDIDRLRKNISAVVIQDTDILIFDNGSINYADIIDLVSELKCKVQHVKKMKESLMDLNISWIMLRKITMTGSYLWIKIRLQAES